MFGRALVIPVLVAFLLKLYLSEAATYLSVSGPPNEVRVALGASVRLPCQVRRTPGLNFHALTVQWMKDGFGFENATLLETYGTRYRMPGRKSDGRFDLEIGPTQLQDDAEFACQVQLAHPGTKPASLVKSETVKLTVVVEPTELNVSLLGASNATSGAKTELWAAVGQTRHLHCEVARSKPAAQIQWLVNGHVVLLEPNPNNLPATAEQEVHSRLRILPDGIILGDVETVIKPTTSTSPSDAGVPTYRVRSFMRYTLIGTRTSRLNFTCSIGNIEAFSVDQQSRADRQRLLSLGRTISFQMHYLGDVLVGLRGANGSWHGTDLIENKAIQFLCAAERHFPSSAELSYAWRILTRRNKNGYGPWGADEYDVTNLVPSTAQLMYLPSRKSHNSILECEIQSRIRNPYGDLRDHGRVITNRANLTLNINYGPMFAFAKDEVIVLPRVNDAAREPHNRNMIAQALSPEQEMTVSDQADSYELRVLNSSANDIELYCDADANPPATVLWYLYPTAFGVLAHEIKRGAQLPLSSTGNSHKIDARKILDQLADRIGSPPLAPHGVYPGPDQWTRTLLSRYFVHISCKAVSVGFPSADRNFFIGEFPPPVLIGSRMFRGVVGESVQLCCDLRGVSGPVETRLRWFTGKEKARQLLFDGGLSVDDSKYQFSFQKVQFGWLAYLMVARMAKSDVGEYTCEFRPVDSGHIRMHKMLLLEKESSWNMPLTMIVVLSVACGSLTVALLLIHGIRVLRRRRERSKKLVPAQNTVHYPVRVNGNSHASAAKSDLMLVIPNGQHTKNPLMASELPVDFIALDSAATANRGRPSGASLWPMLNTGPGMGYFPAGPDPQIFHVDCQSCAERLPSATCTVSGSGGAHSSSVAGSTDMTDPW